MLHVKCPNCDASYKLSEDLYRRKAAGFGVVVTCRHCKNEIHVQDGAEGAVAMADGSAAEAKVGATPAAAAAAARVPPVAAKPAFAAPRPGAAPRAGSPPRPGVAPRPFAAPRTGATARTEATPQAEPVTPSPTTPTRVVSTKELSANKELSAPRLVALSPGLLGVGTALDTRAKATDPDPDADPDSGPPESVDPPTQRPPAPLEAADLEPPTAIVAAPTGDIFESAPDSATPLDSQDYVEEPPKRLPQAPPVRRFPTAPRAPTKAEPPSATSAPKIEELVHGPAVAPEDKKGPPRKRQASGDLTDDLLSGDLGFDAPVPIAPPDAGALLRAPISAAPPPDQPATPSSKPPTAAATKKPESEKSSARGFVWVVALVALGGAAFAFRDRLPTGSPKAAATSENVAKSEPAAPAPPPVTPPEPAPAAPEPTASAAPEPVASAASPEATDTATPTPSPVVAKPGKPLRSTPDATPKPEPAPTPTVAPPREPPAEATGPFDAAAARASLDTAAAQASSCRKPGDPSGVAVVTITFSPSGRVTTANIGGPPFAATPTGGCIASTLRKARVPPFIGEMVTVRKTVTIQ